MSLCFEIIYWYEIKICRALSEARIPEEIVSKNRLVHQPVINTFMNPHIGFSEGIEEVVELMEIAVNVSHSQYDTKRGVKQISSDCQQQ